MTNQNKTASSDLKLEKNILVESIFKINNNIDFSEWYSVEENDIEVKLESNLGVHSEEPSVGRVTLKVEIFSDDFLAEEKPFYCKVEMQFIFKDHIGEYTESESVVEKFGLNMISIAYPYIRAYISTLSSISGIDQIHIPTINVFNTFKK